MEARITTQEVGTTPITTIITTEIIHTLMVTVGTTPTLTVRAGIADTITPTTTTPEES